MEELYHTFQYSLNTMGEVEDCVSQRMGRHTTKRHLLEKMQLLSWNLCKFSPRVGPWTFRHARGGLIIRETTPLPEGQLAHKDVGEEEPFLQWRRHWQLSLLYNLPMLRMELTKLIGLHIIKELWKWEQVWGERDGGSWRWQKFIV